MLFRSVYESGKNIVQGEGSAMDYANIALTRLGVKATLPNASRNIFNKLKTTKASTSSSNKPRTVTNYTDIFREDIDNFRNAIKHATSKSIAAKEAYREAADPANFWKYSPKEISRLKNEGRITTQYSDKDLVTEYADEVIQKIYGKQNLTELEKKTQAITQNAPQQRKAGVREAENDPTYLKRFTIGIVRSKMRLYDVENSAQDDIADAGFKKFDDTAKKKFEGFTV